MITKWIAFMIGKIIKKNLFKGGSMDGSKVWWKSKTIWAAIVTALIAIYNVVGATLAPVFGFSLPIIPDWVFAFLGALGIYARVSATTTIK
jgi:fucose permease